MRVGDVEFDAATGELRSQDGVARLEPQPAAVLALLVERAGELVTHAELEQRIWGSSRTNVNYRQGMHYCIRQIRRAVGDSPQRVPATIETIPRRGYRLRVPGDIASGRPASGVRESSRTSSRLHTRVVWVCLAASLLAVVAGVERRPNRHHELTVALLSAVHSLMY